MNLSHTSATPHVRAYYIGGPLDGGVGPLEPTHSVQGVIRRDGGQYDLIGFQLAQDYVADVLSAMVWPDRCVYEWRAST